MKLSYARIFVRDLEAARSFYREALGLRQRAGDPNLGYYVFDSGAAQLVVESVADDAPAEERVLVGRLTGLSFAVDDIAAEYERLKARRVRFSGAPEAQAWGGILATFVDTAGNELQLVQSPNAG
jgi:catechol 2,3-dioxygenase-like lactoylglutathione lyase family enzyme